MGFLELVYQSSLPFPPPVDHVLSEISTMTCPSWVAIRGMALSFIAMQAPLQQQVVIHEGVMVRCKEAWLAAVHSSPVEKNRTQLGD